MSPRDQVVAARPQDVDVLSRVIALSFHALAPSAWLIPEPDERARIFPWYFRLYVQDAMERGSVYTTSDRTAAALWFPAGDDGGGNADYDTRLAAATGPWVDRFRLFDAILDKHHPAGLSHDHLAILAVHPEHQRQGVGTALLAAHHSRLDLCDPPQSAYLEASDASTRELYLRHGYTDHGEPIALPAGPQMYPMLRHATRS